jgi:hypothetical protein
MQSTLTRIVFYSSILLSVCGCILSKETLMNCDAFKQGEFYKTRYTTDKNHVPKVTWYINRTDSIEIITRGQPFMDTAVYKIRWLTKCKYYRLEGISYRRDGVESSLGTRDCEILRATKEYSIVRESGRRDVDTIWKSRSF